MNDNVKDFFKSARSAFALLLVLTVLLGGVYPLLIAAIAQTAFPDEARGSLIEKDGKVIGSKLLGQKFTEAKYFRGRPSAKDYDSSESLGSNLSPANPKLLENVNTRISELKNADPENKAEIPVDLVTASASGLDPHISLLSAEYQIERVAKARNMQPDEVKALIIEHISPQSKIFGEPYVNVVELNLSLDKLQK